MKKTAAPKIHLEIQTHRTNPVGVLRSTFRKDGKIRHASHGRITGHSLEQLKLIQATLRDGITSSSTIGLKTSQSREFGASQALLKLAKDIGLDKAIYSKKEPWVSSVLAMVVGRLLYAGSKLSLANVWKDSAIWQLCGIEGKPDVNEHCYAALDKLLLRQEKIQKKLAGNHLGESSMVLYDITSSYLEGEYKKSDIVLFGYNRDQKKGHKQIVIGLVCNKEGCPVAVEVFAGNTKDESTVIEKIEQIRRDYGVKKLTFVGDRGMVTRSNYQKLKDVEGLGLISALTHPEITKILRGKGAGQELFEADRIVEIPDPENERRRLFLCRNEQSRKREEATRRRLLDLSAEELDKIVAGAKKRVHSESEIGVRLGRVFSRYKMGKFLATKIIDIEVGALKKKGKQLEWSFENEKIEEEKSIDGCYVIASTVDPEEMDAEKTVGAYKNLSKVEQAFRNLKTVSLEMRPLYHKTDERIRAHVFLCMLAYYLQWHFTQRVAPLFKENKKNEGREWTLERVIERLKSIRRMKAELNGVVFEHQDSLEKDQAEILKLLSGGQIGNSHT